MAGATPTATSLSWLSGTWPGSPRPCCPSSTTTRTRPSHSQRRPSGRSAGRTAPTGWRVCAPSWGWGGRATMPGASPPSTTRSPRSRGGGAAPPPLVLPLVDDLLALLRESRVDHTSLFRSLGAAARGDAEPARRLVLGIVAFDAWTERWRGLDPDPDVMDRTNPVYIPRNHLVEEALAAATTGDLDPLERLLAVVVSPYEERPGLERYAAPAPQDFGPYRTFCGT